MSEIQKGLVISLTVGTAAEAASFEQKVRLKEEVIPLMRRTYQVTGDIQPALDAIQAIMGDDWKPGARWKSYIDSVLEV